MNDNIIKLETLDDVSDQAAGWAAKIDRGLTQKEALALQVWMSKGASRRRVLFEMTMLMEDMDDLSRLDSLFPEQKKAVTPSAKFAAIAASFVFCVCIGIAFFSKQISPSLHETLVSVWGDSQKSDYVYETQVGEYSNVTLNDGSELTLNTNTLVKVKYFHDARIFYLSRGEIHIDVAHDVERPLSVVTHNNIVQAVGTAFNVKIIKGKVVELIVTDGEVRVAESDISGEVEQFKPPRLPDTSMAFLKGEKATIGLSGAEVDKMDGTQMNDSLSWQEGNLIFRGETLQNVLREVERYTEFRFDIVDDEIKNFRIAGMYRAGDVNGLLLAVKQNFNIDHKRTKKNIILLKKEG